MKKWGVMALSFCLFGLIGVDVWAGCCSYVAGGVRSCEDTSSREECKKSHSPSQFFQSLSCCPPGTDFAGQCKPNFDRCNKGNLATLNSFTIVPLSGGFNLKWETSSELDSAGFFIWRGTKDGDEYKNVHQVGEFIPAQGKLIGGATYSYKDTISDFQKGTVYCYGLEDVDTSGITSFHYDFIRCFPK